MIWKIELSWFEKGREWNRVVLLRKRKRKRKRERKRERKRKKLI